MSEYTQGKCMVSLSHSLQTTKTLCPCGSHHSPESRVHVTATYDTSQKEVSKQLFEKQNLLIQFRPKDTNCNFSSSFANLKCWEAKMSADLGPSETFLLVRCSALCLLCARGLGPGLCWALLTGCHLSHLLSSVPLYRNSGHQHWRLRRSSLTAIWGPGPCSWPVQREQHISAHQ